MPASATLVLFDDDLQAGWLSGGCLEPQLAKRARHVADSGGIDWVEVDTRSDDDLLAGSALGCRGRLRIALLPLRSMPGIDALIQAWLHAGVSLRASISADGGVAFQAGSQRAQWQLDNENQAWSGSAESWRLSLPRLPRLLILGAGPETSTLIPLLRELGWWVCLAERRARWNGEGTSADACLQVAPAGALHEAGADAALVMHHDFELDREALDALAGTDIDFIGLLGPRRRRDDLFKLLTPGQRDALAAALAVAGGPRPRRPWAGGDRAEHRRATPAMAGDGGVGVSHPHAVVVLAAGGSTRLGQPKQLLTRDGETLVHRAVRLALATSPAQVLVVVGANADSIAAGVADLPCEVVSNSGWQSGMAGSLHIAGEHLIAGVQRVLVLVCDQPGLERQHLDALLEGATRGGYRMRCDRARRRVGGARRGAARLVRFHACGGRPRLRCPPGPAARRWHLPARGAGPRNRHRQPRGSGEGSSEGLAGWLTTRICRFLPASKGRNRWIGSRPRDLSRRR